MDPALREFRCSMCDEHLDEAAALFDVADALRADPLAEWEQAGAFEQRVEAHIDALVLGGEPADTVCDAALAAAEDPGACYGAAAAYAVRGDGARARVLADRLAGNALETSCADAVARAFALHLPVALEAELLRSLSQVPVSGGPLWRVLGERRCDTRGLIAKAVQATGVRRRSQPADVDLWFAATHCADRIDPDSSQPAWDADDLGVRTQALACGLRRRGALALKRLNDACASDSPIARHGRVAPMLLATAGGASSARVLIEALAREPCVEVVEALGVCGSLAAVRPLIECLADAAIAAPAAMALHVLTGLAPMEDARLEEPVDEDELFERERERFRRDGSAPKAADGLPYARHVQRLSLDPVRWTQLLHDEAARFGAGVRYRFGQAYSLAALLEGLRRPRVPRPLRQAFADEALFRHAVDLRFSAWTPVRVQRARLESRRLIAAAKADASPAGSWSSHGRALDGSAE